MKSKLLLLACIFSAMALHAQTTYHLNWETGFNSPESDLTIDVGDTVIWTWTDDLPHTVENDPDNSVEPFDSGFLTGLGQSFSHTFTVIGVNDYICGVHSNMYGTITVEEGLGVNDINASAFNMYPNPTSSYFKMAFTNTLTQGTITVYNLLGKPVFNQDIHANKTLDIPVSAWAKGMYLVKVSSNANTTIKRLVIQ
ncbi:MAG: T9SS type A sorting domain-containing protein [Algicola sp.]|nr:T9SS type A sorting domain-containing protein [Algicola sp.]